MNPYGAGADLRNPIVRLLSTPSDRITLDEYRAAIHALLHKAEPSAFAPDVDTMFKSFKSCPDTTDRALMDQACHAVEGLPAVTTGNGGNFESWKTGTAQLASAMLANRRFDEARMWCIIRRLRLPEDVEPLLLHSWCLEEQMNQMLLQGDARVRVPTLDGFKTVDLNTRADQLQENMRAHLLCALKLPNKTVPVGAIAGLVASYERSGDVKAARKWAREGVAKGLWVSELQRPAHFVPTLLPRQPWHDADCVEMCGALEQAMPSIKEEFEKYIAQGHQLSKVGARSGEALLVERGTWEELPLFNCGRMDHEVCSKFPETVRVLTERCADASGIAFCGGGEVAFRVLTPGTKLKSHTSPTNARLTCHLGVSIPLGAEPGVSVGGEAARPWSEGKCIVFDDSFEHYEELDDMAEGDCVTLTLHFWHPAFEHKNDPDWKVKGLQEIRVEQVM